jgi:hypothetical protein
VVQIYLEQCKGEFREDGALRDVQVVDANAADWQRLLELLRSIIPAMHFTIDGEAAAFPSNAASIFAIRAAASPTLVFRWEDIEFATHFFAEDDLEFHFWLKDVRSQAQLEQLLSFITHVGGHLQKSVLVYHEGWEMNPFFYYDAKASSIRYSPQCP